MNVNQLPTPAAPTLRQILSFLGIEHSGDVARRAYLQRVERERAGEPKIRGIEVEHVDIEVIELT